jgi:hypothetical protein
VSTVVGRLRDRVASIPLFHDVPAPDHTKATLDALSHYRERVLAAIEFAVPPPFDPGLEDLDEEVWGPMPTEGQYNRALGANEIRIAVHDACARLLNPGMSEFSKDIWAASPSPLLGGRVPSEVVVDALLEVFDAIDQLEQGDFA